MRKLKSWTQTQCITHFSFWGIAPKVFYQGFLYFCISGLCNLFDLLCGANRCGKRHLFVSAPPTILPRGSYLTKRLQDEREWGHRLGTVHSVQRTLCTGFSSLYFALLLPLALCYSTLRRCNLCKVKCAKCETAWWWG